MDWNPKNLSDRQISYRNSMELEKESQRFTLAPGLVNVYSLLLKMAIEIVDCPIKNIDFP